MSRPCNCGSGKDSWWENDARGIPLTRVCVDCKKERLKGFRPEVLVDPGYEVDEPIEPEPEVGGVGLFVERHPDWDC